MKSGRQALEGSRSETETPEAHRKYACEKKAWRRSRHGSTPEAFQARRDGTYTEVRVMAMEIPGILKTNPVQDVLLKEARVLPERPPRQVEQQGEKQKISRQEIENQAKALEKTFLAFNRRVELSVNETINQVIIKVVDAETDKVIKEIPAEEIQHLIARIKETIGLLVDEKI
jgi:flagellar protein FlaG